MKKNKTTPKQIAAIIAIVLLVAMYLVTLFIAIFDKSHSLKMLLASAAMTVIIPIVLWLFLQTYQAITKRRHENDEASHTKGPVSINDVPVGDASAEDEDAEEAPATGDASGEEASGEEASEDDASDETSNEE